MWCGNDGYVTLQSGIIIKWGLEEPISSSTDALWDNVTFSPSFPSECFAAFICRVINATSGNNEFIGYLQYVPTRTSFTYRRREKDSYCWLAIGK